MLRTKNNRRRLNNLPRDPRVMAIFSGLSVTVHGYMVELERDTVAKVATVKVRRIAHYPETGLEKPALLIAAKLLAQRAQRFLGKPWRVVPWEGILHEENQHASVRGQPSE